MFEGQCCYIGNVVLEPARPPHDNAMPMPTPMADHQRASDQPHAGLPERHAGLPGRPSGGPARLVLGEREKPLQAAGNSVGNAPGFNFSPVPLFRLSPPSGFRLSAPRSSLLSPFFLLFFFPPPPPGVGIGAGSCFPCGPLGKGVDVLTQIHKTVLHNG